jgi:hypothetical protein
MLQLLCVLTVYIWKSSELASMAMDMVGKPGAASAMWHVAGHTSHVTRRTCYCISECSFIALRYVHDTTEAKHLHPTSFKSQNPYQNMRMQAVGASPLALPSARSP